MTLSAAIVEELVNAGLQGSALVAACWRIQRQDSPVCEAIARTRGAERTARWRERRKQGVTRDGGDVTVTHGDAGDAARENAQTPANPGVSQVRRLNVSDVVGVTQRHTASHGDGGRKKENPPHPLKKKLLPHSPQRGVSPSASQGLREPIRINGRCWLPAEHPLFRELGAMRGKTYPTDRELGWWFDGELVAKAEGRLVTKVTVLLPLPAVHDPPQALLTG
ncbi:MAG: hypothetical protein WC829_02140 [Hyphomicrobium sp.]|jgi:hypothetical protein